MRLAGSGMAATWRRRRRPRCWPGGRVHEERVSAAVWAGARIPQRHRQGASSRRLEVEQFPSSRMPRVCKCLGYKPRALRDLHLPRSQNEGCKPRLEMCHM